MASMSKLDAVYRSILLSKFFTKGWGKPENLKRLFAFRKVISNRETCKHLVESDYPVHIDKYEDQPQCRILEGHFVSPFVHHLPGVVPEESEIARFQVLLPKVWPAEPLHPVCLHLAGTGDHFYWRRRMLMARPLLKEAGIGSILLENPFYGARKPKNQTRSSLHNVSDIFVMGGCLILESLALFHWCERQGFGPLGITGISMGGHMASVAGSNWHKPLPIIPCLSWTTASCVFTQGVMSGAIPWQLLQTQYFSDQVYQDEIKRMVHSPEESEAFLAGVHFSRTYPSSLEHVQRLEAEDHSNNDCNLYAGEIFQSKITKPHSFAVSPINMKQCSSSSLSSNSSEKTPLNIKQPVLVADSKGKNVTSNALSRSSFKVKSFKPEIFDLKIKRNFGQEHSDLLKLEAIHFMRGIMDECTHLGNFSSPVDPSLSIIVTAKHDAYVPRDGIKAIPELWPGSEVRYIDAGHIAAFLFNQGVFRKAIIDGFEKTAQKYYGSSLLNEDAKTVVERDANS